MTPFLSVIVPMVHRRDTGLEALEALEASDLPRAFWELIVVIEGADPDLVAAVAPLADRVLRLHGEPHGPSYARNRGAEVARGEILVFVDADMCVEADALRRFAWRFAEQPDLAAAFGRYRRGNDRRGLISRYRDLLNHHLHHHGRDDGFWAECAAARRSAFEAVGMFDEWRFPRPQIEALELGKRFRDRGHRVVYQPDIQARHLKRWTFGEMVAADLKDRGVPRSRLGIRQPTDPSRWRDALSALLVCAGLAVLLAGFLGSRPGWAAVGGGTALLIVPLNLPVFRLFLDEGGLGFALATVPLHLVHSALAGVAMALGVTLRHSVGDPLPSATAQAFSEVGVVKWPPVPRRPADPDSLGVAKAAPEGQAKE